MNDELIKRLRIAAQWADKGLVISPSFCLDAADAIEELSRKGEQLADFRGQHLQTARLQHLLKEKPLRVYAELRRILPH